MNVPQTHSGLVSSHVRQMLVMGALCGSMSAACDAREDLDVDGQELAAPSPRAMARALDDAVFESIDYEPATERYEYVGRLEQDDPAWLRAPSAASEAPTRLVDAPDEPDEDGGRLEVLTRDGRMYRQRPGTRRHFSAPHSRLEGREPVLTLGSDPDVDDLSWLKFRELITDDIDDRKVSTAKNKHAVMVKVTGGPTSTGVTCSASMITPRVFLTAAHCVTDDFGNWALGAADFVMPAARGQTYSGTIVALDAQDTPFGARAVVRWYKPEGWTGSGVRFDYAMMVIGDVAPDGSGDVQWDPEPAYFAKQSCASLEGTNFNLRGYPGRNKECLDSPNANGNCGGYGYGEWGPLDQCTSEALYYDHDSQEGQSGSPIYRYDAASGDRFVVGINRGTSGNRNFGHKIREGSFDSICEVVEAPENQSSYFGNGSCD